MKKDHSKRSTGPPARRWRLLGLVALAGGACWLAAEYVLTNPFIPAGSVGYVYEEPRVWGEGGYQGTIEGPRSLGGTWKRLRVIPIEVGPRNHLERLAYPVEDGSVELEWELQLRPDRLAVREVVEEFGGEEWYERHVKPLAIKEMRKAARTVEGSEALDVAALEATALEAIEREMDAQKMPFLVENLLVREFRQPDPKVPVLGAWKLAPGGTVAPAGLEPPQGSAETNIAEAAPDPAPDAAAEEAGPPPLEAWVDSAPPTLIDVSHRREFRGMWLATVSNVDWPSRYGLSVEKQKKELIAYLDGMETMNMNALIFQIRGAADAFYKSALDPWSRFLTGTQGKDPGYDPLEFAIEECRKRSIELHVWINPFRAMPVEDYPVAKNHISRVLSQFARPYASMIWMDPGAREVRDFVTAAVMDVVTRYEIDGVHLDDYFYPYPENGVEFDDAATYAAYLQCCGQIEKDDWRRQNVDSLIAGLSQQIRATKPYVKFGVSPFGLYRPGEPAGTKGFDQYNGIYSDPKKWLEKGWIDYVTPQLYWRENSNRSYSALLNWWGETNVLRRHIYAGNSLLNIERRNGNWPFSEYETQLNASREAVDQQSLGNIFFGMRVFRGREGEKIRDRFAEKLYPIPALSPAMPWLGNLPPDSPWHVRVAGGEIRWSGATSPHLKHWALYRRDGENAAWELQEVFPASTTSIGVDPGTYALSAVDRLMQESVGVLVEVREPVEFAGENVKQAGEEAPEEEGAGEG